MPQENVSSFPRTTKVVDQLDNLCLFEHRKSPLVLLSRKLPRAWQAHLKNMARQSLGHAQINVQIPRTICVATVVKKPNLKKREMGLRLKLARAGLANFPAIEDMISLMNHFALQCEQQGRPGFWMRLSIGSQDPPNIEDYFHRDIDSQRNKGFLALSGKATTEPISLVTAYEGPGTRFVEQSDVRSSRNLSDIKIKKDAKIYHVPTGWVSLMAGGPRGLVHGIPAGPRIVFVMSNFLFDD